MRSRCGIGRLPGTIAQELGTKRRQRSHHLRKDLRRCGDDLTAMKEIAVAGKITDETARFLNEEAAGRDIPRVEPDLPESVVEPRGDIGEIEAAPRRGTAAR